MDYLTSIRRLSAASRTTQDIGTVVVDACVTLRVERRNDFYDPAARKDVQNREAERIRRALERLVDGRPPPSELTSLRRKMSDQIPDSKPVFEVRFVYDAGRFFFCNASREREQEVFDVIGGAVVRAVDEFPRPRPKGRRRSTIGVEYQKMLRYCADSITRGFGVDLNIVPR